MTKRTIIEIAERVGVSAATVSRAINNAPGVSSEKRRQILAVAEELNYHPNAIARSLQGQRTNTLAYVADVRDHISTDLFFFKNFITALAERCTRHGMDLLIHPVARSDGQMEDMTRILRSGRADGLILTDILRDDPRVCYLRDHDQPFIAFGRTDPCDRPYAFVDVDGEWGIHTATNHLIASGHRLIGFLGLPLEYSCAADRQAGYCRALSEAGLDVRPEYMAQNLLNESDARVAMARLLTLPAPPTAFVAASDILAIHAMNVASQRGMLAGRDYAITGFDDLPLAEHTNRPLTTLRQPLGRVCDELIGRLVAMLVDNSPPSSIVLRPELIVRESSVCE